MCKVILFYSLAWQVEIMVLALLELVVVSVKVCM